MNLSLERVLRFVAVAEQLSFTRAASLLRIDQPWLSRQIMQLEDQLGFMLFDRSGAKIALTPEGLEFLRAAQDVAAYAHRLRVTADEMSRRTQSALRVGAGYATFPVRNRARLLETFAVLRPSVTIDLSAYEWSEDTVCAVIAGGIDFGIVFGPVTHPDIEVCVLEELETTLAIPEENELAQRTALSLADLSGQRVVIGMKDPQAPRYQMKYGWVERVGAIPALVLEGRRFLFDVAEKERLIYLCYTPGDRLPPRFVRRPIIGECPSTDLLLIRSKRTMSSAAERFWRLAEEMAAESKVAV